MNYDDEYRPEKAVLWLFLTLVIGSALIVWLR